MPSEDVVIEEHCGSGCCFRIFSAYIQPNRSGRSQLVMPHGPTATERSAREVDLRG
jgi:hypothetical protein